MTKKNHLFIFLALLAVAYILSVVVDLQKPSEVPEVEISGGQQGLATTTITLGREIFTVELAQTHEERVMGLSGRENLSATSGMLFIFPDLDDHGIWMKEMRFSLDILWLDSEGTIVSLEENVSPETFPTVFRSSVPAQFVLEVPAGTTARLGIDPSDTVLIPEAPLSRQ